MDLTDIFILGAIALISVGIGAIYVPAGLITGGVLLVVLVLIRALIVRLSQGRD